MNTASMTVIGAGSYGTALAITLARNSHQVVLWGHDPKHIHKLEQERSNQAFLPGVSFPDSLSLETDLKRAVEVSLNILIVVPSHVFGDVLKQIQPYLRAGSRIIWATKGLERDTGRLLQDVAREVLGNEIPLAVLSGPTFAKELAAGMPTAISIAATDSQFGDELQQLFHCGKSFRVYKNSDMVGVQLGGAVKNVIAIGAGISDGMGFGANARTALITRGLAEMSRLGAALGADPSTFMGMAGLGDLVLTCTDNQSRNRRFGMMLGHGVSVTEAEQEIGQVVEGYRNTKEVKALAERAGVEMPITEQIYQILYCHKNVLEAAQALLGRATKDEIADMSKSKDNT
ncbi:NAD(P)H-dependent glycerol-3-phosphate dehydrogenase [Providencia burhodogranariea]|uniref:Glycerol-3-phosphate dehydrogenase [NAD(P)+] n=1 Tax=Providencia burhodogranariea DSM 19968 TaxID=1141662 RepID=K8W9I1_9GAMM|nr:NAD(P)H-dependent glycerol-3-phosphate dehydrogenase [Providencia burhodogranariea]EKT54137.1 NAD(P)H-dependent glycerol-3-phosphate dehydrogenase [Providencia burhodogranariea DSM 19968]